MKLPCYVCWSDANRSSMIRIPATRGQGTRTEIRCVDPLANPYLALAAILASGLDGIENIKDDETIKPVYDNIFSLTPEQRVKLKAFRICRITFMRQSWSSKPIRSWRKCWATTPIRNISKPKKSSGTNIGPSDALGTQYLSSSIKFGLSL
jgi:hypothetical protein